jgi:hypothetical protein
VGGKTVIPKPTHRPQRYNWAEDLKMRRVKVYGEFNKKNHRYDGMFHCWGKAACDDGEYSIAIVELDNGDVAMPEADCISFIDRPELEAEIQHANDT